MTEREIALINKIGHQFYTVENIEYWISQERDVVISLPELVQGMAFNGFYEAVKNLAVSDIKLE